MRVFKSVLWFIVLLLSQVLVLNHVHLLQYATPLLYVYVVIGFPRNMAKWAMLSVSFLTGLVIDVFSNTPGVAAGSMTFIALLQPYLLLLFINRESPDDVKPALHTLGFIRFTTYALLLVLVYCLLFFTLEAFNFFNWLQWLGCVGGSTLVTLVLILVIENMKRSND